MTDALVDAQVGVRQVTLGPRRRGRQFRLEQEVIRGGSRRFEVQTFHRTDAAIGPMRQQHRSHRRAVRAEAFALVLPQGPATAELLTDLVHGRDHQRVLGIRARALVPVEIVRSPERPEMTLGGLEHTQPRVATLIVDRTTRQGAQGETEGDEHDEAGEHSGGECSGEGAPS